MSQDLHPEDLLRGRVVDRCDAVPDWDALERLGATDPTVWMRLARDLRLDCEIRGAVGPALAAAVAVELPRAPSGRHVVGSPRGPRTLAIVGWAAALLLAVLWWRDRAAPPELPDLVLGPVVQAPGSAPDPTGPRPLDAVTASGGEALPGMLVRATPEPSGRGLRVVYVHRELREATVDEAFAIQGDTAISAVPLDRYETPTEF